MAASPSTLDPSARQRIQLAAASRMLSDDGQDDFNQGQISARSTQAGFLIKRAMRGFSDAGPDDMIVCPQDPDTAQPREAPPETPLHRAIYAARPDIGAIIHTHAPHCLVFGATDLEIRPISHEGAYFRNNVTRFTGTSHTILDHGVAAQVAEALGGADAVFLVNHGVVVTAPTIRKCTVLALMLERHCRLQLMMESVGRPYSVSNDADIENKRKFIYSDVSVKSYWNQKISVVSKKHKDIAQWL